MWTAERTSLPEASQSGCIAVLNAGSSSIKFAAYDSSELGAALFRGQIEKIGLTPHLRTATPDGKILAERSWTGQSLDHAGATREILSAVRELILGKPVLGVGHRVVHGGTRYAAPVRINAGVLAELEEFVPLAPLHQPHNLTPIRTIAAAAPHIPQVACFDTAFHRDQPHLAQLFPLPRKLIESGIRRYGFHGLSYEYIASRMPSVAPEIAGSRVIVAHLGNGASLCALRNGRSIATTMGFTAVDGLMMGTRCGALDPGVLVYLIDRYKMDARELEDMIYRCSGLLGVSGISSDMRTLRASQDPAAAEAIALFIYRIVREIGSLAAALGGLDALVFTAGIGENDPATRAEVVRGCGWLGLAIDETRNEAHGPRISADGASASVWVIPTDEEQMIARHTVALLAAEPAPSG